MMSRTMLNNQKTLLAEQLPGRFLKITASDSTPKDPLIARGLEREQYMGIAILLCSLIVAVGFLSRRFEYALLFALSLSIVLIVFLLTI